MKESILGNTNIGPALEVAASYHQCRYGIEIMIVDSTPACTHACANFSRAHMTFH